MENKSSIIKRFLSGFIIFIFIKLVIFLFTVGNDEFNNLDLFYNLTFGVVIMIFILYKVFHKTISNDINAVVSKDNKINTPTSPQNKPLHPK